MLSVSSPDEREPRPIPTGGSLEFDVANEPGTLLRLRLQNGGAWIAVGRLSSVGILFLNRILYARALTPAVFGELMQILSLFTFCAVIANWGLGTFLIRVLAQNGVGGNPRQSATALTASAFRAGAITTLVVPTIACLLWLGWIHDHHEALVTASWILPILIAAGVFFLAWHQIIAESLRGLHELKWATAFAGPSGGPLVNSLLAVSLLAILALDLSLGLTGILAVTVTAFGILTPMAFFVQRAEARQQDARFPTPNAPATPYRSPASWLRGSTTIMLAEALHVLQGTIDLWLTGTFCSDVEVGMFAAARQLAIVCVIPMNLYSLTIISSIPELVARGETNRLSHLLRRAAGFVTMIAALWLLLIYTFGGELIPLLFGVQYVDCIPIAITLCLGNLLMIAAGMSVIVLTVTGHARFVVATGISGIILQLLVSPWASGLAGAQGIAISTASITAGLAIARMIYVTRCLDIHTLAAFPFSVMHAKNEETQQ